MAKTRSVFSAAGALAMLAVTSIPLLGQVHMAADDSGVTVNLNGTQLMHRSPVHYPAETVTKGVQGTVVVRVSLDANGAVTDAAVLSGSDELGKSVTQSVLTWHFDQRTHEATRVVNVDFVMPANTVVPLIASSHDPLPERTTTEVQVSDAPPQPPAPRSSIIDQIDVTGLPESVAAELLAGFPVHAGDPLISGTMSRATDAARQFDPHLTVELRGGLLSDNVMKIAPRQLPMAAVDDVAAGMRAAMLISAKRPVYPPLAKMVRQHGTVRLEATVGKDGSTKDVKVVSGAPLLIHAATEAVSTWVYQPTTLAGSPVEIVRTIDINFDIATDNQDAAAVHLP
jgi:TonB family protein